MINNKLKLFCVLAIFITPMFTPAQTDKKFYFENISIPQGLSNTQVWDILQDKYGFLWVSTQDGLNRYDGYKFKVFKNDPEDKTTLLINKLHGLLIDKQGNNYYLTEHLSLKEIFENNIEKFIVPQIIERVKDYLKELDK